MQKLIVIAVMVIAAWYTKQHYDQRKEAQLTNSEEYSTGSRKNRAWHTTENHQSQAATSPQSYQCDGREHCSQMNSKTEADWFVQNCPNTKMDGDRDGDACENDSRW